MSIDDIDYLKQNSFKQSYTFIIDSEDRDHYLYPNPNNYTINFTAPFKNVFGLEVVDASVPRTMYNIDKYNNILYYKVLKQNDDEIDPESIVYDRVEIETGDYSIARLILELNETLDDLYVESVSNPPDIKNMLRFVSNHMFVLDMNRSSMKGVLGFNLTQNHISGVFKHNPRLKERQDSFRYFQSVQSGEESKHIVEAPGIVDLIGEKYVTLHCPEIEEHSTLSLSYSKYNLGLARFKLGIVGYNDENISINRTQLREFHPIGKFSRMTLEFKTKSGNFYDFKGVNHNITFSIHYYEANSVRNFGTSILNPNYNANMLKYLYSVDEQDDEEDSDDEEISSDNLDSFKTNEEIVRQKK